MPRSAVTNRFKLKEIPASISFNGSTTTVAYSGAGVTGFASASSFAGWVKIARGSSTARIIVGRWGTGGSDRCAICFQQVSPLGSENYALQAGYYNGSAYTVSGTTNVPIDTWFHLAFTWDGTTARSYINGTLLTGTSASPASGVTTGLSLGNQGGAFWRGNQSMVKLYTRVLSQDEITALSLMRDEEVSTSGLWVDWHMDEGAGSSVTDYSGNSRTGTITSGTFVYDSPMKARKLINGNKVRNGDFEYAPPFMAATSTGGRWIDGTAAGSTTNDIFGWYSIVGVANFASSFDSSVKRNGSYSLKLDAVDNTGRGRVWSAPFEGTTSESNIRRYGIPVLPNTTYVLSGYIKTLNAVASSLRMAAAQYDGTGTAGTTTNSGFVTGTSDWTQVTASFTTASTAQYVTIRLEMTTAGAIQTGWYDDVTLTPVYPEGRVPANGNLVKNFDFEVAPTFVAATTGLGRWIDGSAAGSTTNATYKWGTNSANSSGTIAAQFDSSTSNSGSGSMKVSTTATASTAVVSNALTNTLAAVSAFSYRVNPGISYTYSVWMRTNYVSGDSDDGAYVQFTERNAAAGSITSTTTTKVKTTTGWTNYTGTITTNAATVYLDVLFFVRGTTGTGTLIMDAWFDDIYLAPTTNPGRVVIT